MSCILSTLRSANPERHQLAVKGLRDGTLTITIAYRSETEIRALVKNGEGAGYGVNLSDRGNFCSCKDALYRGVVCKHQIALCVFVLQQTEQTEDRIHLMWNDGTVLCGQSQPKRFWQRWTYNALNWPDVCPACVHQWLHPAAPLTKDEHFFSEAQTGRAA